MKVTFVPLILSGKPYIIVDNEGEKMVGVWNIYLPRRRLESGVSHFNRMWMIPRDAKNYGSKEKKVE